MEKKYAKIIALDIDGVLNGEDFYAKTKGRSGDFDPEAIALLNQLEPLGVEIVISSSWGDSAIKPLQDVGLKLPIIGVTKHFYEGWLCRGNEIDRWLCENMGSYGIKYGSKWYQKDFEYVIFDDDTDMLLGQKDNFIQVNRKTGLTQEDIDKARAILERKYNKKTDNDY